MRSKIQRGMLIVICITLLIAMSVVVFGMHKNATIQLKKGVEKDAKYISAIINEVESTENVFKNYNFEDEDSRVTLINNKGVVLYDSKENHINMENHKSREEIKVALQDGEGNGERYSATTFEETYYYAILLENGNLIRLSRTTDSIIVTTLNILPWVLLIGIFVFIITILISRNLVKKFMKPLEDLDLDNPLQNKSYPEIESLLNRIEKNNRAKEEADIVRREFSANVSHELKTPLTSISGYAEIIENGLVEQDDIPRFAEKIHEEANRLISLIEDIIKISSLDEGKTEIIKENVDLYQMIRDILARLSLQIEKKKVKIELVGEPITYFAIKTVLDEALYNLIENAIKYNNLGGSVSIWIGNSIGCSKIIIKDTGIGIAEKDIDRIFERFYRVDKSHSKKTGGTGLGLSIVKHAMALHNIEIDVKSKLDEGTTVTLIM